MSENVRMIKISTGQPEIIAEETAISRNRRNTRRRKGGFVDESIPAPALGSTNGLVGVPIININKIPDTPSAKAIMEQVAPQTGGSSAQGLTNVPPGPQIPVTGGAKPEVSQVETKVVLKRKNRTSKVLLKKRVGGVQQEVNPTKTMTNSGPVVLAQAGGTITKKHRKVTVRHVRNRMKRTKRAVKHAKTIPIEKLRKILIDRKLIKPDSKAPESILRQIYADSIIVSKKTL